MTDAKTYYDTYWDSCLRDGKIEPTEEKLFQEWLRPGMSVLDYGCGDGTRYGPILKAAGIDYHGADISESGLAHVRGLGLSGEKLQPDGSTSMAAESCDAAICFEVVEHLIDPDTALREIHRVLKPGGVLLLSVPNGGHWFNRLEFLATGFLCPGGSIATSRKRPWMDAHIRFFNPAMLRAMVRENGFQPVALVGSPLSLSSLPVVYRTPALRRLFNAVSRPVARVSSLAPGLLSNRLFTISRKQ